MNDDEALTQLRNVLEALLKRARKNEVRWQIEERRGPPAYVVKVPSAAIRLEFASPETEPDYYAARLINENGNVVKSLTASESDLADWHLLSSLWDEAYRSTSGWDKALAKIEAAVRAPDPVGGADDDIPF